MITPAAGYMVDPTNPNGVVRITDINPATGKTYGSGAAPAATAPTTPAPASQQTYVTPNGSVVTASGQIVSGPGTQPYFNSAPPAAATPAATAPAAATPSASNRTAQLQALLNNPSLSADQKSAIQSIYDAVSTNDTNKASQITAAMAAASQYSDPYFKAQIRLATDALQRGLAAKDGDLAFQESSLSNALKDLTTNTAAAKDNLSLSHAQELKQLAQQYETQLDDTRTGLAATGFTDSSKRARSEQILGDNNNGLVESSNRAFSYQTGQLDSTLSSKQRDIAAQVANLQALNDAGKLDLTRQIEDKIGSSNLGALGYSTLGNIGGSIPYNQAKDQLSFASSFVS